MSTVNHTGHFLFGREMDITEHNNINFGILVIDYERSPFLRLVGGSLICGKIFCGSPHLREGKSEREEKNVGGRRKVWGGRSISPPTQHFYPPPQFFPPTNEENHR